MCDLLVALPAATIGGVTLFAKNSDRPPDEPQRLEWHPPRTEDSTRTTYLTVPSHPGPTIGFLGSRPDWMWGVEHGVNEAGVAAGNATIYTSLDPRTFPDALTGMDLVRLVLERASSASESVTLITELIERHGQGGSGHRDERRPYWSSFMVADPTSAWVVETSGREWAAEEVTTSRCTSNRTTIAAFDEIHRHPRQPVDRLVDPRLEASRAMLARSPLSASDLRAHLRSHEGGSDGWTVCMHVPEVEATTASIVVELPASGRPLAWVSAGSPCRSVFVPIVVGEPLGQPEPWERFATLPMAARANLDGLEDRLSATVAGPARTSNIERWTQVGAFLSTLSTSER